MLPFGSVAGPMLIDGSDERRLGTTEHIPYGIAGGRRTGVVVIPPCHTHGTGNVACEIHHIIILKGLLRLLVEHPYALHVRVAARASFLEVGCHVGKSRMVCAAERHTAVERRRHKTQRTALAATLHGNVLSVPLWQGGKEINGTHQSEVDMLHIIIIARIQSLTQIAVGTGVEGVAYLLELPVAHPRVESVNLRLEAYAAAVGIIAVAQRLLDGLHACSRRTEHHRARAFYVALGDEQIAVDALSLLVHVEAHEIGIGLVGVVFMSRINGVGERHALQLVKLFLPEGHEVGWFFGVGLDVIHREAHFNMVCCRSAADIGCKSEVEEAGVAACANVDHRPAVFQNSLASMTVVEHVAGHGICHLAVLRHSVSIQLHLHQRLLAGLIEPVGMVWHGDPQEITTVRIIFSTHIADCHHHE